MRYFLIAIGIAALIISLLLVKTAGFDVDSNMKQREAYWEQKIAGELQPGSSTEQLQQFARSNGQTLSCYQNYEKERQCSFDDNQSIGGTKSRPVILAVIFTMKDDKAVSHQVVMTPKSTAQ